MRWNWIEPKYRSDDLAQLVDSDGTVICDFGNCQKYDHTCGSEPSGENKRLIGAAPELLEALTCMVDHLANREGIPLPTWGVMSGELIMEYRSLIAKIKGKS